MRKEKMITCAITQTTAQVMAIFGLGFIVGMIVG